jgi:hypothetical protein
MADDERHDPDHPDTRLELPRLRLPFRGRTPEPAESAQRDADIAPSRRVTTRRREAVGGSEDPPARRRRPLTSGVHLPGPVAAAMTGAVVGLLMVGLTAASLHVCSDLRGTSSCGKPGILVLLAITAAVILLGSLLLRVAGVAAHGSTSFLGVGLLVVLILLALLPVLDEWWVVIAVPALAMATFVASWWLTTAYAEPGDRAR